MRKIIILIVVLALGCIGARAQENKLFVTKKDKTISSLTMQVDSLNLKVSDLMAELDSLKALAEVTRAEREIEEGYLVMEDPVEYSPEEMDSLLTAHYERFHNETFQSIADFDPDSIRFSTKVPDSILVDRLTKMNSYISLPFNYTVKNYMILYSEKNREKLAKLLGMSTYYFPIFEEILDKYELPVELKYMSIIESSLNPVARSRVGARGIWQFMYYTGKLYGLKINSFVDERLDVVKAADAAARFLKDSYDIFGDWALAISSYNCGVGNVNKAIRRSGGKRDFWSIYPYLPRETRGYVPAFVGAMYAMTYYKEYGIIPEEVNLPSHTDTFHISRNLHFKQINELVGTPLEVIRDLNPQYTHDIVPGNEGTFIIKLPYSYTNSFIDCQDSLYTYKADTLMSQKVFKSIQAGGNGSSFPYKVRNGDNLGAIARRHGCSVSQLKKWNHLRSDFIRVGQVLYIYK